MFCRQCNSMRVLEVNAKCNDCCTVRIGDRSFGGYVPRDLGIGGGDYIKFKICLECGTFQNAKAGESPFPLPISALEEGEQR